jgi:hypothetical protein
MTIAEQIKRSLDTITDWTSSWEIANFGVCFNKAPLTVFNDVVTKYADAGDWLGVACTAKIAELNHFETSVIIEKIQDMLTNVGMFTSAKLPKNVPADAETPFHVKKYVMLEGYYWSEKLDFQKEKWDAISAFNALRSLRWSQGKPFYACNIDTGAVKRLYNGEWTDYAALMNVWLKFGKPEIRRSAVEMAEDEWTSFMSNCWQADHFIDAPEKPNWEMHAPVVLRQLIKFLLSVPYPAGQIKSDVHVRYLKDFWDSPQWGGKNVVVEHNPDSINERLDGTFGAVGLLHTFYRALEDFDKNAFRQMLTGEKAPKMADALLGSALFDSASNRFRNSPTDSVTDYATCLGCATLFLEAILPNTGSLAVPLACEGLDEWGIDFFNSHHFGFNYDARTIKVPVYSGKLKFNFGTQTVEESFSYDGIYTVTFSQDWNSILSKTKVADLDAEYIIPPKTLTTVEALTSSLAVMLLAFPLWYFGKEIVRHVRR